MWEENTGTHKENILVSKVCCYRLIVSSNETWHSSSKYQIEENTPNSYTKFLPRI